MHNSIVWAGQHRVNYRATETTTCDVRRVVNPGAHASRSINWIAQSAFVSCAYFVTVINLSKRALVLGFLPVVNLCAGAKMRTRVQLQRVRIVQFVVFLVCVCFFFVYSSHQQGARARSWRHIGSAK